MTDARLPQIAPEELARRLDQGERLQVLDIRAAERVAAGHIEFGRALAFQALPGSELYRLPSLDPLQLDAAGPVAVICNHGNSSQKATAFLRERGVAAYSVTGGMAAWETVYLPRALTPTPSLEHVVQLDRVGKGALSYVLASEGEALVVDPARHLDRYEAVLRQLGARAVGVVDTHVHADYLSGARAAASQWDVPYYLHPDDARSPYDGTAGRFEYQPVSQGDSVAFGRATLRVEHTPGHTLGSVTLVSDDGLALTGDFLFVRSIGRPDLGGKSAAWAALLWKSLERARGEWPGELLILPAHYGSDLERRADRAVAARFDVLAATNEAAAIQDERAFLEWIAAHTPVFPESYRTIKTANLGLVDVSEADAELLEFGPNQCAIR
jgi:glyoxylase-like metal-dependent hydrolase (beta-lactamase superfamily II)